MSAGRFHLTISVGGRPAMQGWWSSEAVALAKFTAAVGQYGGRRGVDVTVVDEETGETLTTWPDEPSGGHDPRL